MKTLIANEWLKLRTIRTPWQLLAAAEALVIAGTSGLILSGANVHLAGTARTALAHAGLVSLVTLILGIMAVTGEYWHKTITDTYLSSPRRARVILAKLFVYTLAGAAFGIVAAATDLITTAVWLAAKGGSLELANGDLWRTVAGGIAWNAAFAAIGVGVGSLVRNLPGAIALAFIWIALVEGIVGQLISSLSHWLPFASGMALDHGPSVGGLSQWGGGLVLLGYAAVFAILAVSTTIRRDVT